MTLSTRQPFLADIKIPPHSIPLLVIGDVHRSH